MAEIVEPNAASGAFLISAEFDLQIYQVHKGNVPGSGGKPNPFGS